MLQLALGLLIMCVNGFVHGLVLSHAAGFLERAKAWCVKTCSAHRYSAAMTASIVVVMAAHFAGVLIWAAAFLVLDIFDDPSTSLYFSIVVYTTLGFGDLILPEPWRILSGMVAANGFLLFGWSTAFQMDFLTDLRQTGNRSIAPAAGGED